MNSSWLAKLFDPFNRLKSIMQVNIKQRMRKQVVLNANVRRRSILNVAFVINYHVS